MIREEALIHFEEQYVNQLLEKYKKIFYEAIKQNQGLLKDTVINGLKTICQKVRELQNGINDYKVTYFQFSILRTSMTNQSYEMILATYDASWYLDDHAQYIEIDMTFLFQSLKDLYKELSDKSKQYIGKINRSDINQIILRQALTYNEYIAHIIRFILQNIEEEQWFDEVYKSDTYYIRWGEYQDKSELVYTMDTNKKTTNDFIKLLGLTTDKDHEDRLVYSVWKDSEIIDTVCIEKNMMFASFKGSNIKNCSFKQSILLGCNFKNSLLNNCNFKDSILQNASFEKAELQNVSFHQGNLRGVNFMNAKFQDVSFEEADLEGAIFSQQDVPFLHLTPSQLQVIYIEGDQK